MSKRIIPGKTPITADLVNGLLADTEANSKLRTGPGLDLIDTGAGGKVIVRRNREGTSPSGFFARLSVEDDENGLPQALFREVSTTTDAQNGLPAFIDQPNGRSGILGPLHAMGQMLGNIGPRVRPMQWLTLQPNARDGAFTLSWRRPDGQGGTTASIPVNATAADVQAALQAVPAIGNNVSVWADASGPRGGSGGPWLVEFNPVPWYNDPNAGLPSADPNNAYLTADASGITGDPPIPGGAYLDIELVRTDKAGPLAFNILPTGQVVWVEPIGDGSLRQYLFQLPFAGIYGRILARGPVEFVDVPGLPALGGAPPIPAHAEPVTRYAFIEIALDGSAAFQDRPDGIRSDNAIEVNHDLFVPPDTNTWLVPVFVPGVGFYWIFECPIDIRLLLASGNGQTVGGTILTPRGRDGGACQIVTPGAYFGFEDEDLIGGRTYLGVRADALGDGTPIFVAPPRIAPNKGLTGTFTGVTGGTPTAFTTANLTFQDGLLVGVE